MLDSCVARDAGCAGLERGRGWQRYRPGAGASHAPHLTIRQVLLSEMVATINCVYILSRSVNRDGERPVWLPGGGLAVGREAG